MLRLEARPAPSRAFVVASPLIALAATVAVGVLLFVLLGKDPLLGLRMFFWEPIKSAYAWSEIAVKATPLILIGGGGGGGVFVGGRGPPLQIVAGPSTQKSRSPLSGFST
jgi:hypothetical protein